MDEGSRQKPLDDQADAPAAAASTIAPEPQADKPEGKQPDEAAKTALDEARKSIEDAASVSGGLWLSYLFVLLYIGIAAGGVTHKALLLENAVKLPFLNVELPLVAFFSLAPILFIIVHAYTLMHFVMLAAKARAYDEALLAVFGAGGDKAKVRNAQRRRLPSNIFIQFLAGPRDIREGGLGWLLKAIAWVSLVIGPVLLLLLIQAQFLPYHREDVTWIQRFAVLGDVVLLWVLWPAALAGTSSLRRPPLFAHPWLTLLSVFPIAIAFFVATFPGGWLGDWNRDHRWIPPNPVTAAMGAINQDKEWVSTSLHHLLFAGEIDQISRRRKSPFSNALMLTGFDALEAAKIDDEKKLSWAKQSVSLHGRNLQGAIFDLADLRKADLTNANLQGAGFFEAKLQGASFGRNAQLQGAWLAGAQLQGASLARAQLQGASLFGAQLQGASLNGAQLQGASLDRAQLQGASLFGAQLQGASLYPAWVWRADVRSAANAEKAWIVQPHSDKSFGCRSWGEVECTDVETNFHTLKQALASIPDGKLKIDALKRLERLQFSLPDEPEIAKTWVDLAKNLPSLATILDEWASIGCEPDGAPDVARALLRRLDSELFKNEAAAKARLANAFLAASCAGAKGLSDEKIAELKALTPAQDAAKGQTPAP